MSKKKQLIIPYYKKEKHCLAVKQADYFYLELNPRDEGFIPVLDEWISALEWVRDNVGVRDDRVKIESVEHPLPEYKGSPTLFISVNRSR